MRSAEMDEHCGRKIYWQKDGQMERDENQGYVQGARPGLKVVDAALAFNVQLSTFHERTTQASFFKNRNSQ